jgi:hypothetical protein
VARKCLNDKSSAGSKTNRQRRARDADGAELVRSADPAFDPAASRAARWKPPALDEFADHGHAFAEHRCRPRRRPSDELAATAFVTASIIAATGTPVVSKATGNRRAFCVGAVIYATGSVLCGLAPSIALIIGGRFIQGLGGGSCLLWLMSLSAPSSLSRYGT